MTKIINLGWKELPSCCSFGPEQKQTPPKGKIAEPTGKSEALDKPCQPGKWDLGMETLLQTLLWP